jgi:hypothetical protein
VLIPAQNFYPPRGLLMRHQAKLLLLSSVFALPLAVSAADTPAPSSPEVSDPAQEMTYAGIGFSRVSTGFSNVDPAVNLTGVIGLHPQGINWAALEMELGTTIASGDVTPPAASASTTSSTCGGLLQPACPAAGSAAPGHFSLQQGSVFGVLRSPGVVYAIGRIGYQYSNTHLPELNGEHSGAAWSLGAGWRYHPASATGVELLYTHVTNGVRYVGLSLNRSFGASKKSDKPPSNAQDQ